MTSTTIVEDDRILPFQVNSLDVRGRIVRLGPSVDTIMRRHDYPSAVSRVLAEAIALTLLIGTSLKFDGRFIVQTRTDGPLRMMVVDFQAPNHIRACATFDSKAVANAVASGMRAPIDLLGQGYLAMTIDQGVAFSRYQGVVTLAGETLEQAADQYFRQSEQVPTRVRLAVAENITSQGAQWRGGGAMVQFLPSSPDRLRVVDFPPGDASGSRLSLSEESPSEDDAWVEAKALLETIEDHELTDPAISPETLLYRLFNERDVHVFQGLSVIERCTCSYDAVFSMLQSFSPTDRQEMIADDGSIAVTCEFCNNRYAFDPTKVEAHSTE